jgi:hypothetical protein
VSGRDIRRTSVPPGDTIAELEARADSEWVRDMSRTRRRFRMAVLRAALDVIKLLEEQNRLLREGL